MLKSVLPKLSSKSFMMKCLTFRSLNNFQFIFIYGVRECYFIVLHVTVQLSQHHLLKTLSFLHCILLPPLCHGLTDHRCVRLFLECLFYPIDQHAYLCACFCIDINCFDYCSFVVQSEVCKGIQVFQVWQFWVFCSSR